MILRPGKLPIMAGIVLLAASLSSADTSSNKKPAAKHSSSQSRNSSQKTGQKTPRKSSLYASKKSRKSRTRGQQVIDGGRTLEIQEALVREHYLSGEPSGKWDDATQQALRRYQKDQGWQSKSIPDSRALIRLGLGPDHGHLLNPETAMIMTTEPRLQRASQTTVRPAAPLSEPLRNRNLGGTRPVSSSSLPAQNSSTLAAPAALSPTR
jgi:hypothetical protein